MDVPNPQLANIKAFLFEFVAHIEKVRLSINFPCTLKVTWKRGTNNDKCVSEKDKLKSYLLLDHNIVCLSMAEVYNDKNQLILTFLYLDI